MKPIAHVVLGFCAVLAVCHAAPPSEPPPCCVEGRLEKPLSDKSLYHLESKWTTDDGKPLTLAALRGRPQLVVMFFATCEYACPILVENLKSIERMLPAEARGKAGFLLVSIDPDRDTPEALRAYRAKHAFDRANWTLLRGGVDDIRELAAVLGIQYQRDLRGQFSHSNVITVLDQDGVVAFQQAGLNKDPQATVTALSKTLGLPPSAP
jgi:protein SCO1/2